MKKFTLALFLTVIAVTGAFAEHHSGSSIGFVVKPYFEWDHFEAENMFGVSFRSQPIPLNWAFCVDWKRDGFYLSLTGDEYIIDTDLISGVNFGFFLGLGLYTGITYMESVDLSLFNVGVRLPVGFYVIPGNFLEIYINAAPSLGLGIYLGNTKDTFRFPDGSLSVEFGLRVWY
ncbi:MAG: DUF3996 domain-containing protein [Treponema sp.]|jgi:hypothetical protein|nr:DUF3996 domain-containing protein [Treponema sp.]